MRGLTRAGDPPRKAAPTPRAGARSLRPARLVPAAAAVLLCACDPGIIETNWSFERMLDQPKLEAYGATRAFDDSAAMRLPPEGIVARDAVLDPRFARGVTETGEPVARIPLPLTLEQVREGRERFRVYCAVCHGERALGRSPVASNMSLRPPPPLIGERLTEAPVGHLFRVASEGYGLMPSYREELDPEERWTVVAYLRALQLSHGVELSRLDEATRARALDSLGGAP